MRHHNLLARLFTLGLTTVACADLPQYVAVPVPVPPNELRGLSDDGWILQEVSSTLLHVIDVDGTVLRVIEAPVGDAFAFFSASMGAGGDVAAELESGRLLFAPADGAEVVEPGSGGFAVNDVKAIAADGSVLVNLRGEVGSCADFRRKYRAGIRTAGGGFEELENPFDTCETFNDVIWPQAFNDVGVVVGYDEYWEDAFGGMTAAAIVWQGGASAELVVPGADMSRLRGINDNGVMFGDWRPWYDSWGNRSFYVIDGRITVLEGTNITFVTQSDILVFSGGFGDELRDPTTGELVYLDDLIATDAAGARVRHLNRAGEMLAVWNGQSYFLTSCVTDDGDCGETQWAAAVDGEFNDPSKWTAGVPDENATALFATDGAPYVVDFEFVTIHGPLRVERDDVTFRIPETVRYEVRGDLTFAGGPAGIGQEVELSGTGDVLAVLPAAGALTVGEADESTVEIDGGLTVRVISEPMAAMHPAIVLGRDPGAAGRLVVRSSTLVEDTEGATVVALGENSQADLVIEGPGASFKSTWEFYVGYDGLGSVVARDTGASPTDPFALTADSVRLAKQPGSRGTMTVSNALASVEEMYVGVAGEGHLHVTDGGSIGKLDEPAGTIGIAQFPTATGTATISGPGSRLAAALVVVGLQGEHASLTITDQGLVETELIMAGSAPESTGTAEIVISNGGVLRLTELIASEIGAQAPATLTVDGGVIDAQILTFGSQLLGTCLATIRSNSFVDTRFLGVATDTGSAIVEIDETSIVRVSIELAVGMFGHIDADRVTVTGGAGSPGPDLGIMTPRLEIDAGGIVSATTIELRPGGVIAGGGTLEGTLVVTGDLAPGTEPCAIGRTTLVGDLDLLTTSRTVLQLDAADSDAVYVDGTATLAGDLVVELLDGELPIEGTSWTLLSATSIKGAFDDIVLPVPGAYDLAISDTEIRLTASADVEATDLDGDGRTSIADLIALLGYWGDACDDACACPADFTDDGLVNVEDLIALIQVIWG